MFDSIIKLLQAIFGSRDTRKAITIRDNSLINVKVYKVERDSKDL